jgi:hypothetical protein
LRNGLANGRPDGDADGHADGDPDRDADGHADGDPDGHADGEPDGEPDDCVADSVAHPLANGPDALPNCVSDASACGLRTGRLGCLDPVFNELQEWRRLNRLQTPVGQDHH